MRTWVNCSGAPNTLTRSWKILARLRSTLPVFGGERVKEGRGGRE